MTGVARRAVVVAMIGGCALGAPSIGQAPPNGAAGSPSSRFISYEQAQTVVEGLPAALPADLAAIPAPALAAAWAGWAERRDRQIRGRLARGDEDSIVNFLLFGTTFTRLPRALNDSATIGGPDRAAEIVRGRTSDLAAVLADPGDDERRRSVREVIERQGIDLRAPDGRERTRRYLLDLLARTTAENKGYIDAIESGRASGRGEFAVRSSLYRARGLSSDTSLRPDYAIHRTLSAVAAAGILASGSVRRVAVIGPGLDFTDKAEGYDFYPPQTTQPFALVESLTRLQLAASGLRLTTLDLNPRVNRHLESARQRAAEGAGYRVVLPRDDDARWHADFTAYWSAMGGAVGDAAAAPATPEGLGVRTRAVRVRPDVVLAIDVRDLNVVLQRLDSLRDDERFDIVVATNVLVYYDVFEQSLALANVASMLRPGGLLLSNNVLVELPATPMRSIGHTRVTYSDRPDDSDDVVWYRRE